MRHRIRSYILRQRFETAWSFLPGLVQANLRRFIRYVDEVEELAGTYLYVQNEATNAIEVYDGPIEGGTGYTAFLSTGSRAFCDIILPTNPLTEYSECDGLAVILHELAHAEDFFTYGNAAGNRNNYESEKIAWDRALAWASAATHDDALVAEIRSYVDLAKYWDNHKHLRALLMGETTDQK
jgi:hypothetical protein